MIVPMEKRHVAQIAALEQRCFSDPWSETSVESECANPYSLWLVEEEAGQVLGYVGSQAAPPEADVMNLAVAPEHRGRGLGKGLMNALCTQLRVRGIHTLFLEVRVSNASARALYDGLGFLTAGCRKKYYVNPTEDALILRKELEEC